MDDQRCRHDFLPGQCAICSGAVLAERDLSPEPTQEPTPFAARYRGRCPGCGADIETGDAIVRDANGDGYVHEGCG